MFDIPQIWGAIVVLSAIGGLYYIGLHLMESRDTQAKPTPKAPRIKYPPPKIITRDCKYHNVDWRG
jgi:hypothetical protein